MAQDFWASSGFRFEIPRPEVVPRASLRLLEDADRRRLARTGLASSAVTGRLDEVLARTRRERPAGDVAVRRLLEAFDRALDELTPTLREAGERAERAAEKTRGTVARAIEKLAENVDAARRLK